MQPRLTQRGLLPPLGVCTWFLYRLKRRTRDMGESTEAIRASVLTDGWNFKTAPPPEARVLGMPNGRPYRWATPEFASLVRWGHERAE